MADAHEHAAISLQHGGNTERVPVSPLLPEQLVLFQTQSYQLDPFAFPSVLPKESRRPSFQYSYQEDAYDLGRPESLLVSPIISRSASVASMVSIASDRQSAVSMTAMNVPDNVNPQPAYVAPSGAAQAVAEHRALLVKNASDDEDSRPNRDHCTFSPATLSMINAFLDQLLFSFLYAARSTGLPALRLAVTEALKGKLAKDAVSSAEEELRELMAGGEEEEDISTRLNTAENNKSWDLELVWKRTRLRVMVYMRLGEMEDEDEERYLKEEHLTYGSVSATGRSSHSQFGLVSWAAAIFLTGVLEYIAEQTLQIAGDAAYSRARRQTSAAPPGRQPHNVVVEEYDVERVALNSGIGRLWRSWRKSLRDSSPASRRQSGQSRRRASIGPDINSGTYGAFAHRRGKSDGMSRSIEGHQAMMLQDVPEMVHPEDVLASNIPLPLDDHVKDVSEIEIPGLARDPDEAVHINAPVPVRRNSFTGGLPTPDRSPVEQHDPHQIPLLMRKRSTSVPTSAATPHSTVLPGAYPEDAEDSSLDTAADVPAGGQDIADAATQSEIEPGIEQKFDAQEMAAYKRTSQNVNPSMGRTDWAAPEAKVLHGDSNECLEVIGGARTTTVAEAAMPTLRGSPTNETEGNAPAPPEDVDQRKSLMKLKDIIVTAASTDTTTPTAPQQPEARVSVQPDWAQNVREDPSPRAGTVDGLEVQGDTGALLTLPSARRQHTQEQSPDVHAEILQAHDIGVAKTSDVMVPSPRSWTPTVQQARDGAKPSIRMVRGDTAPHGRVRGSDSSVFHDSPTDTTRDPSQSGSTAQVHARSDVAPAQDQQKVRFISEVKQQKRSSIPGVALSSAVTAAAAARNSDRQTWATARQQQRQQEEQRGRDDGSSRRASVAVAPAFHKNSPLQTSAGVQEHPILSRMVSIKRHRKGKSDSPVSFDANDAAALTSASIKGPEDFDSFVQAADTVKYTLTPSSVRDIHVPPVELSSAPSFSFTKKPRASIPPPIDTTRTGRSAAPKQAAAAAPDDASPSTQRKTAHRRSVGKPSARHTSTQSRSGLMAREPRVHTESTRDFADFIRSTGPSAEDNVGPFFNRAHRASASHQSAQNSHAHGAPTPSSIDTSQGSSRQDRSKSVASPDQPAGTAPLLPVVPAKAENKKVMQARGATIGGSANSELIDFIRSGPDRVGEHRISRSVAPFRSTMDSEQLKDIGERINGPGPLDLRLNTDLSSNAGSSIRASSATARTSANSRSALLGNHADAVVHPAHSAQQQRLATEPPSAGTDPERKRYRNKDPYAIDYDDDDHDLDLPTALPKNKQNEESFMDFLNNHEPPQDHGPRPVVDGTTQTRISKTHANSTGRSSSLSNGSPVATTAPRVRSMQAPSSASRSGASSMRNPPGSIPTRDGREASSPSERSNLASFVPRISSRAKMEARDDLAFNGTSDLADFLKNSAPPGQKVAFEIPQSQKLPFDPHSAPAPSVGRRSKLNQKEMEKENKKVAKNAIVAKGEPKSKKSLFGRFGGIRGKSWIAMP